MKLNYFQLEMQLAKKLSPIYIISGDELLLKQDAITLIRKAAKRAGFTERFRLTPEAGFNWEQLYPLLYSSSLLAEKRLLEFVFRDMTPNKTASTILKEYAEKPVPENLLVLDMRKLDNKISKTAWYQALEKAGTLVTIWPISQEQLPQWIINRAKKYKLQLSLDAARLLSEYAEGNLVAAAQAIEKIYLSQSKTHVDVSLIKTILTDESRFNVFDFIENLFLGKKSNTLRILENLKNEGTEPVFILWGIARELRLLSELAQQLKQGQRLEMLWQKHRIFARRQTAMRHFLSKHSPQNCVDYLKHAAEIDRIIKGAAYGDAWRALQLLCLRIQATL